MKVDPNDWPEAAIYFEEYSDGLYDQRAYLEWIYKADDVRTNDEGDALYIGRPGVDGIEFAIRRGSSAVWAYHPIGLRWQRLADDIERFKHGWLAGKLTV